MQFQAEKGGGFGKKRKITEKQTGFLEITLATKGKLCYPMDKIA